ncbi:MAG: pyridoxamine 5'-phosphate oxidase family protein, partial [Pseudomonadota bacterium]
DARLLEESSIQGRAPKVGLLIKIQEAFMHCPKAFVRSKLWDASQQIDRAQLPSFAEILLDHCRDLTQDENDRQTKIMAERGLY